jgi:hypothetical protein
MKRETKKQPRLMPKTSYEQKPQKHRDQVKVAKSGHAQSLVEKVLALIRNRPGIRPSEINRILNIEQSDGPRGALLRRGLVRKVKEGSATRYYPL